MSTVQPPSDGEGSGDAQRAPVTKATPRRRTPAKAPATAQIPAATPDAATEDQPTVPLERITPAESEAPAPVAAAPVARASRTRPAPRTRRTTAKTEPVSRIGEAPEIMDAALGARTPLAGAASQTADTSASPVEPLPAAPGPDAPTVPLEPEPAVPDAAELHPPVGAEAEAQGTLHAASTGPHARTVTDLADRLDDSRFFSSLFDFTFTSYVTRKLAGPIYVVGLVLIGLGVVIGFSDSLGAAIATQSPAGAFVFLFGIVVTLVAAILSVLVLRVGIEVFVAIIEIAQNTRARRRPPRE